LEKLQEVPGYLGAGVFSSDGRMLGGVTEVSGLSFEIGGKLFHDAFLMLNNNSREAGFGRIDLMQVHTETALVLVNCCNDGKNHFHTILVMRTGGNVAAAKLKLEKVVEELKQEFK
jgi:roadblock/LC7 domain-containing protein